MAQAVIRRLFASEARVHARVTPCVGFVVDELALGQVFMQSSLIFLCQYHSAVASRLCTVGPLVTAGQGHGLPPST
jgi:hypothetical protein